VTKLVPFTAALVTLLVVAVSASATPVSTESNAVKRGLFDYDRSAPLGVVSGKTTTSQGIVREELSYLAGASLRLKAYFVHPASGGPWPLVIWSPGAGGDRNEQLPAAIDLARRGSASLLVDPPPIRTPCRNDLPLYVNYVVSRRRAVDLAATLPNVDAKRIAAAGFSFGAEITATLSGVDHRIAAFSLSSGRGHHTGFVRIFCKSLGAAKLNAYVAQISVVDPVRWVGRATRSAMLIQNGTRDELTPRPDVLALYKASRKPKELRWYSAGHDLNPAATEYRAQWLLRQLSAR
jgi:dienelactone hydrolase